MTTTTRIGPATFDWGARTYVMGIVNVTPDSFSGDGLLPSADPIGAAVEPARRMVAEGADLLDIGGESTRPGHEPVDAARRGGPGRAGRGRGPRRPAGDAHQHRHDEGRRGRGGARCRRGPHQRRVGRRPGRRPGPARRRAPACRWSSCTTATARSTRTSWARSSATCARPWTGRSGSGVDPDDLIVDPGFGFGKTAEQNLVLLRDLGALRSSAGRSCWGPAASRRWAWSWTCRPMSASRRRSPRPRSGSPPGRTSSASTMCRPTSEPPG